MLKICLISSRVRGSSVVLRVFSVVLCESQKTITQRERQENTRSCTEKDIEHRARPNGKRTGRALNIEHLHFTRSMNRHQGARKPAVFEEGNQFRTLTSMLLSVSFTMV